MGRGVPTGIGIKRISVVYRRTSLVFLMKMLNRDVEQFRNIARESLELDMKKRGVEITADNINLHGYGLKRNGYPDSTNSFGCQ